jgi:hypothetical protein
LAGRAVVSHEMYEEWHRTTGAAEQLCVSYHLMSGGDAERTALAEGLIKEYRPECNAEFRDPTGSDPQEQLSSGAAGR